MKRLFLALVTAASGCTGAISIDSQTPGASGSGISPSGEGDAVVTPDVTPDEVPANESECVGLVTPPSRVLLNRLTAPQYDRTVKVLLGVDSTPADEFLPDSKVGGFPSNVDQAVTELHVRYYADAAEELSQQFELTRVTDCSPSAVGERPCVERFVRDFGRRAFRRPLTEDDQADFLALYDALEVDYETGVRALVSAFLQSPEFLYLPEFGEQTDGAVRPLTNFELATRLSYFLWETMPDEQLFEVAAAGELSNAETLEAQARRMLEDPRSTTAVRDFHRHWLMIDELEEAPKNEEIVGTFDERIRRGVIEETLTFADYVVRFGDARVETLFGADFTFADQATADFYGIELEPLRLPGTEALDIDLLPVAVDTTERRGIMGHASFHAGHATAARTSPILRGAFVWTQVMCEKVAAPPSDVDADPPGPAEAISVREQYAQHQADPACSGCHQMVDPPGFAFERYGPTGLWRDTDDNGEPLDTTVTIVGSHDMDGNYDGPLQMIDRISKSEGVRACIAQQWFRYAFGRDVEQADTCNLYELKQKMEQSGGDIRELIIAIVTSSSFRTMRGTP